ncbi:MAG: hypothetical protein ABWZ76_06605 [Acidimicrobiales bacterium]
MITLIQHTSEELRAGLRSLAEDDPGSPPFHQVKDELFLAGFVRDDATLTPAGQRFLRSS